MTAEVTPTPQPDITPQPAATPPPTPFDPNALSPEIQAYVDQQRTQASTTARKNALKDAANDPNIVSAVRASLEEEARMSAEEKVQRERDAIEAEKNLLAIERNGLAATSALVGNGIDAETASSLVPLLTTADPATTTANVEAFVKAFGAAVEVKVEAVKNELLANGGAPRQGEGGKGSEQTYRDAHKAALEAGKTAEAVAIQRKALAEGFTL